MRKAFSLSQIIFIGILVIVLFKFVVPKINSVKEGAMSMAYVGELKTAMKDIKDYYSLRGELATLDIMTFVRNFENNTAKLEVDKPIKYGVKYANGAIVFCTQMTLKEENNKFYLMLEDINQKEEVCKEFVANTDYINLKRFNLF